MPHTRFATILLAVGFLLLPGCGGGDGPTGPGDGGDGGNDPMPPSTGPSVSISPQADTLTALGAATDFAGGGRDASGGAVADSLLDWTSTDTLVATVDGEGRATAVARGTTLIVVTLEGAADSATLVVDPRAAVVIVTPAVDTLAAVGDTVRLLAEARDANDNPLAEAAFVWSATDTTVAVVDQEGLVTARADGQTDIVVAADGAADTARIVVGSGGGAPPPPPGASTVNISPQADTLTALGAMTDFAGGGRDASGLVVADSLLDWTSTDTLVATVDGEGRATAVARGTTLIVVTLEGAADSATLVVDPRAAVVIVTPAVDTLAAVGDTVRLLAEARDANDNPLADAAFAWSSQDPSVATVDAEGLVTAQADGQAGVVATAGGAADTARIVVGSGGGPNTPPEVTITSPTEGDVFLQGDTIRMVGSAMDAQDGPITGSSLIWRSDLDGKLGEGDSLAVHTLSPGNHEITLTASDSDFSAGSDAVNLTVQAGPNLAVQRVNLDPRGILTTETSAIQPVVANAGGMPAGPFDWEVRVNGAPVASGRVTAGIAAMDSVTLPAQSLGPFPAGDQDVTLALDTGDEVMEAFEDDNLVSEILFSHPAGFDIELDFQVQPTGAVQQAFVDAVARWEELIVGDLSDIPLSAANPADLSVCDPGAGQRTTPIDDLLILVRVDSIDGPGQVLGRAGPCLGRVTVDAAGEIVPGTPIFTSVGVMEFDEADLAQLQAQGLLQATILHEMGHVLGIGAFWETQELLIDAVTTDPTFVGDGARDAFLDAGGGPTGEDPVPVEGMFGPGTRNSHWRESVLVNELMTGFIDAGSNPTSAVTVRSLSDQWYAVDPSLADPYQVPLGGAGLRAGGGVWMVDDVLHGPFYAMDRFGNVRPVDLRRVR